MGRKSYPADSRLDRRPDGLGDALDIACLPINAVVLDSLGTITAVNPAWKDFGGQCGLRIPNWGIGRNYLEFCRGEDRQTTRFASDLQRLLAGRLDLLTFFYPCHSPTEQRWFFLIGLPLTHGSVALLHVNVTGVAPFKTTKPQSRTEAAEPPHASSQDVGRMVGVVKHSIYDTLSSQLRSMLMEGSEILSGPSAPSRDDGTKIMVPGQLTKRQRQVLGLIGQGKTNQNIAVTLGASPNTIKVHVTAILRRLKLKNRTEAALIAANLP
jgi:DNA-binding CsgD family transcriptional regulator